MDTKLMDLRSDTVTRPTPGMREAMSVAEVGDDVFGEDPTVNRLEERVARILGKEAALFVPSGTMGNQLCVKVHTAPGDEIILEKDCHLFNYETGALAFLSGVQANCVAGKRGVFTPEQLLPIIRPDVYYMPRTSLICVENTHNRAGGTVFPLEQVEDLARFARSRGVGMHLDGARLWNAVVATGVPADRYCAPFDSVSVCFSKGLGAPVGSSIAGTAAFVEKARHYRKIFGGGMRQAGILAAGALYALENHRDRLKEDHEKATALADILSDDPMLDIDRSSVHTNIVVIGVQKTGRSIDDILELLAHRGVLLTPGTHLKLRAVTHMDVSMEDVLKAGTIIREALRSDAG